MALYIDTVLEALRLLNLLEFRCHPVCGIKKLTVYNFFVTCYFLLFSCLFMHYFHLVVLLDLKEAYIADSESSSIRALDLGTGGSRLLAGGDPIFSDNLFKVLLRQFETLSLSTLL